MDVIKRNLIKLLRCGAFEEKTTAEAMSVYKWKKLIQMVCEQDLEIYLKKAMKYNSLPMGAISWMPKDEEEGSDERFTDVPNLNNSILNKRLNNILLKEKNDTDAQPETEKLLGIIIYNVRNMLNKNLSIRGIIELGRFLRTSGHKVDFVKIEEWLEVLHLKRIAQLQGSILITDFNFEKEEIPFVNNIEKDAHQLLLKTISQTGTDRIEEWHFKQKDNGFVRNNSRLMRKNIRRNAKYFRYASIESTSTFINNFIRSLSEIEE